MELLPCKAGTYAQEGWAAVHHSVMPKASWGGAWADMRVERPEGNADCV